MSTKRFPKLKLSGFKRSKAKMPQLEIGDLIAAMPIVQGGMGVGISLSGLASSVANEGGIGVIAANAVGMLEPDYYTNGIEANIRALRKEIRKARQLTSGIIGVNIMVALNDFQQMLQTAIEEKADIVFLGAGLPLRNIPVEALREANVKVAPIVSSARAANLIFRSWQKTYDTIPDAVVVEGPKAGGHLGFKLEEIDSPDFALEQIIPEVVKTIKTYEEDTGKSIPVIAAGGIYSGDDIYKFIKLGASGVQMGTRFVATHECDADPAFKQTYVDAKEQDIQIIKSPVGMPGRAIRNAFLEKADNGELKLRCAWKCLSHCNAKTSKYCISESLNNARLGKLDNGYAFAGSNAYRIESITHVKHIFKELHTEYLKMVALETVDLRAEFEANLKHLAELRTQYKKNLKRSLKALRADIAAQFDKRAAKFLKDYQKAKVGLDELKADLEERFDRKTAGFLEEYQARIAGLEKLRAEYMERLAQINALKSQLAQYLDISSLNMPSRLILT